jgi:MFS family permease
LEDRERLPRRNALTESRTDCFNNLLGRVKAHPRFRKAGARLAESRSALLSRPAGVVVACTVGNAVSVTPMVYTVFGMFLIPIATEFGWPRSAVSFVLLILAVASAASYPVIGRIIDRHGARRIMLAGNVMFAASVALVALVPDRPTFYLVYALIGVTAAIPSSVMFTKVIVGWFDRHRGLFLGVAGGVGNGTGAAIAPLYVHLLMSEFGWRGAFVGLALAIVLIGFPVLYLLLHDAPRAAVAQEPADAGMTFSEARRTGVFWSIVAAVTLGAGCVTAVFAHVVPMLMDRGIGIEIATTVLATFSMVTAAWQTGVGYLLDRIPKPWIAAPFYLATIAGLVLLETAEEFSLLLAAGFLMGLGLGTEYGILPYFLSRYFGLRHYGAISGTVYGVIVLTQGIAPFLMDVVFDVTGNYELALATIGAGLLVSATLIARLKPFNVFGNYALPAQN